MSHYAVTPEGKLRWGYVFIIGLGFFTTAVAWALYNSYVPIFLRRAIESDPRWSFLLAVINTFIGFIMIIDNIAAITLQPYIGAKSDKTWTRFGRRMPYILVGLPLAAAFFALIPLQRSLIPLIAVLTVFNVAMAIYRAPVVALMPDLVPSEKRSEANGVINFMGGVGAIIGYFVGSFVYEHYGPPATFAMASIVMIAALVVLFVFVKEPEKPYAKEESVPILTAFKEVFSDKDKSGLFMLLAIMFWFFSFNVLETWFTTYGVLVLHVEEYIASRAISGFLVAFIAFSIPAGIIAHRIGRRNTIRLGILGLIIVLSVSHFIRDITTLALLLTVGGVFWAMININSIVIVWEIGGEAKLGAYTGLYYFFSQLAAIFGPFIAGIIFDALGFEVMFPLSVVYMVMAFVCMLFVKKGEAPGAKTPEVFPEV